MSEITVRHEVEALLKLTRQRAEQASDEIRDAVSQGVQTGATLAIADFHGEVLAELDKIIQRYIEGDEPAKTEVAPERRQDGGRPRAPPGGQGG